ncbi:MAG: hypothetical protein RIR01_1352 [Bacteroidota bacterium]|jgi:hypothetical protein
MKPIQEAELIVQKKTLTLEDYNRFIDLGNMIKDEESKLEYDWLCEAIEIRLPEIAQITGNYDFVKANDL